MKTNNYDVTICGGGLAGLTLALQLKKENADISILILEKRDASASLATHKVGESTVEIGSIYFADTLGLKEYLDEKHLPKHGLRFWFNVNDNKLEDSVEYGSRFRPPVNKTYQLDRGLFENDLMTFCADSNVDISMGTQIQSIDLSKEGHIVHATKEGKDFTINSKWVVDATGQRALLTRQLNQEVKVGHNMNAVWFRVKGDIDIDDWITDENCRKKLDTDFRRLATNHIMGKGYWIWIIPLSSGVTSLGIVADPQYHNFREINSLQKAKDWIAKHEKTCYDHLAPYMEEVLDFKMVRNYAWDSEKYYSQDRWGITGIAAAFSDPFYSPGSDFIALGNTWLTELITKDLRDESIYLHTRVFNELHKSILNSFMVNYENMYGMFGNPLVMHMKILWDFSTYWAFVTLLFKQKVVTNIKLLNTIRNVGNKVFQLNDQVQTFFAQWHEIEGDDVGATYKGHYVNYTDFPYLLGFFLEVADTYEYDQLIEKIDSNVHILEKVAAEMFRVISHRHKGTDINININPYTFSLDQSKAEIEVAAQLEGALKPCDDIGDQFHAAWLFNRRPRAKEFSSQKVVEQI